MKDTGRGVLILCDREEEYAYLMTEFIRSRDGLPWQLRTYTDAEELKRREEKGGIHVLAVAESIFCEELRSLEPGRIVLLNESGIIRWPDIRNVNKYQQAENVLREILEAYLEASDCRMPRLKRGGSMKLIGIYSPVRRCLQTSFALTLGQLLSESASVLYMNFQHYAGITELVPDMQTRDMADLLYFLNGEEEKFALHMQTLVRKIGGLDYVPPMKAGQNLFGILPEQWLRLLQKVEEFGCYEYVLLDLSESIQGLFEILSRCFRVFTLTKSDRISQCKLLQYEQLLGLSGCGEILKRTSCLEIPHICRLPEEAEQYTRGELAEFVKGIAKELHGAKEAEKEDGLGIYRA